jgi:hypothetical protein
VSLVCDVKLNATLVYCVSYKTVSTRLLSAAAAT